MAKVLLSREKFVISGIFVESLLKSSSNCFKKFTIYWCRTLFNLGASVYFVAFLAFTLFCFIHFIQWHMWLSMPRNDFELPFYYCKFVLKLVWDDFWCWFHDFLHLSSKLNSVSLLRYFRFYGRRFSLLTFNKTRTDDKTGRS